MKYIEEIIQMDNNILIIRYLKTITLIEIGLKNFCVTQTINLSDEMNKMFKLFNQNILLFGQSELTYFYGNKKLIYKEQKKLKLFNTIFILISLICFILMKKN